MKKLGNFYNSFWNNQDTKKVVVNVSAVAVKIVVAVRTQLLRQLWALSFIKARESGDIGDLNANCKTWAVVKATLTVDKDFAFGTYSDHMPASAVFQIWKENKTKWIQKSIFCKILAIIRSAWCLNLFLSNKSVDVFKFRQNLIKSICDSWQLNVKRSNSSYLILLKYKNSYC